MSSEKGVVVSGTTVREVYQSLGKTLGLDLVSEEVGLENSITSSRIQKLGLALAGHTRYLRRERVQFVGRTEIYYLDQISSHRRLSILQKVFQSELCCVLVTTGLTPPTDLVNEADKAGTPILKTDALSSEAMTQITAFLQEKLAPRQTIHGVLVELHGLGVLLIGDSGIGKSECALDLILRGHRLVSDDLVLLKKYAPENLLGSGPTDVPNYMELRGLGIINVKDLFGVSVLSPARPVDLVVKLEKWPLGNEGEESDRLGLKEKKYRVLGVDLPLITMPVAPGRNLATLVEVAVRIQMLKKQGYNPAVESVRILEERLELPVSQSS